MNIQEKNLLSPEEAAQYLNMSVDTLANYRSEKIGPKYHKPAKRKIYYFRKDLDDWIKGGQQN